MAARLISLSYPQTVVQGEIVALPARAHQLTVMSTAAAGTGATVQFGNNGTIFAAGVTTPHSTQSGWGFMTAQTGDVVVVAKPL